MLIDMISRFRPLVRDLIFFVVDRYTNTYIEIHIQQVKLCFNILS